MQDLSLAKLDAVRSALETAASVQEVKNVLDMAKAAETYARQTRAGKEIGQKISEYILRAERKLGEMLKAAKDAGQITRQHNKSGKNQYKSGDITGDDNATVTLADAGISLNLSSRAQKLAAIPEKDFEEAVKEGKSARAMLKPQPPIKPHYLEAELEALYDEGLDNAEIAKRTGLSKRIVRHAIEHIRIRRDAKADAPITPEMLSLSAQQKLELAIKQHKQKLDSEYERAVQAGAWRYLDLTVERWKKEQAQAKRIIEARKGIMTRLAYRKILACLHPDWVTDPGQKRRYEEAFREFTQLEKLILSEKESPTTFMPFPKTRAEWEELRRKTAAERKAKRGQHVAKN